MESPRQLRRRHAVDSGEQCDDGNDDIAGDGCAGCVREDGWECTGVPSVCTLDLRRWHRGRRRRRRLRRRQHQPPETAATTVCTTEDGYDLPGRAQRMCAPDLRRRHHHRAGELRRWQHALALDGCAATAASPKQGWDLHAARQPYAAPYAAIGCWSCRRRLRRRQSVDIGRRLRRDSCQFEASCGNGVIRAGRTMRRQQHQRWRWLRSERASIEASEACGQAIDLNSAATSAIRGRQPHL